MDFSNFDLADGAIIGGIAGFAEEAGQDERFGENEQITKADIKEEDIGDSNLRLLYNENPDLVVYLINKFLARKKMATINREFRLVMNEVKEEIKQNKKEEER